MNARVKHYFDTYEQSNECFETSDGYLFHKETDADAHAQTLSDKRVTKYTRGEKPLSKDCLELIEKIKSEGFSKLTETELIEKAKRDFYKSSSNEDEEEEGEDPIKKAAEQKAADEAEALAKLEAEQKSIEEAAPNEQPSAEIKEEVKMEVVAEAEPATEKKKSKKA